MQANNTDWGAMRELIARTGLTQDEIAHELGVSLRTVNYLGSPTRAHKVSKTMRAALERLAEINGK